MATYTIFCAIQHEWPPFSVHIEKSLTVDDLKKAIKAENPNAFASTDAHRLTLYQVDVGGSTRQERQENLAQATLTEDLDPFSKLNKLYPSPPPEDTIHILIQLPERSKRKLQDEEQDEESSLAGIKRLKKELSKGPAFVQPLSPGESSSRASFKVIKPVFIARDYGSRKHRRSLPEDDILSHTKRLSVRAEIVGDPDISLDPLVDAETPAKLQGTTLYGSVSPFH